MHLHILGICGTFMAGIAAIARQQGHRVTGSDENAWPPMSDQLAAQGIEVLRGYDRGHLVPAPDLVIVGNAMTRGNPAVEHLLDNRLPYVSGPDWLARSVLAERWVLAVSGTHGKTTTTALLAWMLESAGLRPGFLIGGVAENFGISARLGEPPFFVIEADEYDSAFFDKRSKFVHYHPKTLVITNIEHDHADIFPDLASILQQFHHVVRIVPSTGLIVHAAGDDNIDAVLRRGCWTPCQSFGPGGEWCWRLNSVDGTEFNALRSGASLASVRWALLGEHNVANALAALAAAFHAGVPAAAAAQALRTFASVKRRLERVGSAGGVTVYDDFAHHPTAIRATITALRARVGGARILAALEPRSNSFRLGLHEKTLLPSLEGADRFWVLEGPDLAWDLAAAMRQAPREGRLGSSVEAIIEEIAHCAASGDHVLIMSNGDFGGIHGRLLEALGNTA